MTLVDGAGFMEAERLRWTEREFQRQVLKYAVGTRREPSPLGWRAYHTFFSGLSGPGFPDLVLVRERVVFAELKAERGRVSPSQQEWLDALRAAGAEVYLWRPRDWDTLCEVLR
jgi:hypothetical protein